MHSFSVSKSTSATSTSTSTSTTTSQDSQPGTADGQRPRSSFMDLSTTVHTPESLLIPAYHQQDKLGLLSKMGTTQINPFEELATYLAVDNDHQGRSAASSLSLHNEPARSQKSSQPIDDVAPIVREKQRPDPTDKWIISTGNPKKPFKCGYKGCGKRYTRKTYLRAHFVRHTRKSPYKCYMGECTGKFAFCTRAALARHSRVYHTFERPFECKICEWRFRRSDHLKRHIRRLHSPEAEKKSPKPQNISESSSAATATVTAGISTMTSKVAQSAGQRQQSSYVGISTTIDTPESMQIAAHYHQQDGLRLLAEVSTSQINPFAALATHRTVTFEDEAVTTGIAGVPNLPSDQYQVEQSPDPRDTIKWIIVDKSQERPYRCGYPGCDMAYLKKEHLKRHFAKHTDTSKLKCPYPECAGNEHYFSEDATLKRHIAVIHTRDRPFQCKLCDRRFRLQHHLKYHTKYVHGIEEEKKITETKEKITRN